jgi:hypothetical protein
MRIRSFLFLRLPHDGLYTLPSVQDSKVIVGGEVEDRLLKVNILVAQDSSDDLTQCFRTRRHRGLEKGNQGGPDNVPV